MKEIGYNESNRLHVRLAFYEAYKNYAQIMKEMLEEIYLDIELVQIEGNVFGTTLRSGEGWDMALNYYGGALNMTAIMTGYLHSTGSNAKVYGWSSKVMDEKIDNILAQTTAAAQLKAFQEFQVWANDYNPRITTHTGNVMAASITELEGYKIVPVLAYQDFTTIYIPE